MSWWKANKRQRGNVKAHEAKENGRYARRAEDRTRIDEGIHDHHEEDDNNE